MLFRQEAVQAHRQKLHGDVFLAQPIAFSIIEALIFAVIAGVAIMLVTGSYARTEQVRGHLVPTKGLVKIQTGQFGTLESLTVREGETVKAGAVLATIRIAEQSADGLTSTEKALDALKRQMRSNQSQVALEHQFLETELKRLQAERTEALGLAVSLRQRLSLQREMTLSAKAAYDDVQGLLQKGHLTKAESERRRQAWISEQEALSLREQELKAAEAKIEQLALRLKQLPNESDQRLAKLKVESTNLEQRQAELEGRLSYTITAPTSGVVASISSPVIGRTVLPQQPLLTILPTGSRLEAELFVPSRASGFVAQGQEVRLLYDAFPYQHFGSFPAQIERITETILMPGEAVAPFDIKEPVYRITASLPVDRIRSRGKDIALQPGMTLNANIVLERRSFLAWLLEPLRAVRERS